MAGEGTTVHTVTIGEEVFKLQRFRGLKAIMAMAAMTRVAREVPDVMADSMKEYQARNTIVITENMARLPRWQSFSPEDFDAAEKNTGKREIELPTPMTINEQVLYALPTLLEKARREVTRLLAILLIPNEELKQADKGDTVEEALDKYYEVLMYEAEIDQLVDLCLHASDILHEQLADDKRDRLGKLMKSLWGMFRQNRSEPGLPATSQPPTTGTTSMLPTSTVEAPTSSTSSEEPTDGTETPLSTVSPGVS